MSVTAAKNGSRPAAGPSAPKRLVVKPLQRAPSLPDDYEAVTWQKLSDAVTAVHATTGVRYSEEELYQAVQDLCAHKFGEKLYDRLRLQLGAHIRSVVSCLSQHLEDPNAFLNAVCQTWLNHCTHMITIRSIFWNLDRKFAMTTTGVLSLWDLGLKLLHDELENNAHILRRIITCLLRSIEAERNGEVIDRSLMNQLTRMLTSLNMYTMLEVPLLQETNEYYLAEGKAFMDSCDVPKYLLRVETRFLEESARGQAYLDPLTRRPLTEILEKQLIAAHVTAMLDKGFVQLCDEARIDALARMYGFFVRVDSLDELKERFAAYVATKGCAVVMDPEKDKTMVEFLLQFKDDTETLLRDAFQKNDAFAYSCKRAFEKVVNCKEGRPAELIAKFVDSYLKAGERTVSEAEAEAMLDRTMVLFRAVHGKDTFEAFYKKDLAKRLLLAKSASVDLEKIMLAKLKTECGSSFTQKLEGMFTDVELCKSMMEEYQAHRRATSASVSSGDVMEQYIHVLTTTYWPSYPPMTVTMPAVLRAAQEEFSQFYKAKFGEKRRLFWQHSLGHCLVRAAFAAGRKELVVSQFQTMVLLLFNDRESWVYKDILGTTSIEGAELKRTLQSLACGKVRVLKKEPMSKDVDDSDVFTVNNDFKAKLFRIKINSIQAKETDEDADATRESVQQDRQYQIDAAAVRIMKTRKKLSHQQLLSELFSQLRFAAKPADLKKRIESLIEREYLERDDDDPNLYHYVA